MANSETWSIGQKAFLACVLEVTARKPGNVHPWAPGSDASFLDFLMSAQAIVEPLDRVAELGVGQAVLECIRATRRVVDTNTNLGIVLLFCPIAMAASLRGERPVAEVLKGVLRETTVRDSEYVYEAIRLADPGGLGQVDADDVRDRPTRRLRDIMLSASDRDTIAWQYANDYEDVCLLRQRLAEQLQKERRTWEQAIISCWLYMLSQCRDSLIQRKYGARVAEQVSRRASDVLRHHWPDTALGIEHFCAFDSWLRKHDPPLNPGTTADLVAAAVFWLLIEQPELLVAKFRQPIEVFG